MNWHPSFFVNCWPSILGPQIHMAACIFKGGICGCNIPFLIVLIYILVTWPYSCGGRWTACGFIGWWPRKGLRGHISYPATLISRPDMKGSLLVGARKERGGGGGTSYEKEAAFPACLPPNI